MADEDLNNIDTQEPPDSPEDLTELDNITQNDSAGEVKKVELDLDDAPFLQDEAPPPKKAPEETSDKLKKPESEETKPETRLQKLLKNKKLVIGAGSGLVLIIILVLFLLLSGEEPQTQPDPSPVRPAQDDPFKDLPPIEAKPGEVLVSWEPFWVEYPQTDGETRFLLCQLSAPTTNPDLKLEADVKTLAMRDAIYYYLSHKPLTFLSNQQNADTLKEDLLGIINGYLTRDAFTEIYIESYLIR